MKWYKHLTVSLDDPDIVSAIELFGSDGYAVFFGTLELMSREFDIHNPGIVCLPMGFLKKRLQLSAKKITKIFYFYSEKNRIFVKYFSENGLDMVELNCPKLKELADEWTTKKLRSESRVKPDLLPPKEVEVEEELEVEEEKSIINPPKQPKKAKLEISKLPYGENMKVLMTEDEHQKLFDIHGVDKSTLLIDTLDDAIFQKKYKYTNHFKMMVMRKNKTKPWPLEEVDKILNNGKGESKLDKLRRECGV